MNFRFAMPLAIPLLFILLTGIAPVALTAQDWPQFRGPDGNGVLEKLEHPVEWGNDKNIAWSVDLPGGGLSSPIVQGDRIFLTTATGIDGGFVVGGRRSGLSAGRKRKDAGPGNRSGIENCRHQPDQ